MIDTDTSVSHETNLEEDSVSHETSLESSQKDVSHETVEAKYVLEDELFKSEDSKEFKSLIESYVNDHKLPVEAATKLIDLVKQASEQASSNLEKTISSSIEDFKRDQSVLLTKEYNEFISDPSVFSNVEEAQNVVEFAKRKVSAVLEGCELDDLLKNKSFIKYMKQERDRYSESVFKKAETSQRFNEELSAGVARLSRISVY